MKRGFGWVASLLLGVILGSGIGAQHDARETEILRTREAVVRQMRRRADDAQARYIARRDWPSAYRYACALRNLIDQERTLGAKLEQPGFNTPLAPPQVQALLDELEHLARTPAERRARDQLERWACGSSISPLE